LRPSRALVSVSDKTGIVEFMGRLAGMDVDIISTGGTALALEKGGIPVTRIETITDTPELLGGRVKSLHPNIYAGILARRDDPIHMAVLGEFGIGTIDMVVVNLYPFGKCLEEGRTRDEMIENIDIGGVSLIRAAAKNHDDVAVLVSPEQYAPVLAEIDLSGGLEKDTLASLATEAFLHTSRYDTAIHRYLSGGTFETPEEPVHSDRIDLVLNMASELRYGENPDQTGALYTWKEGASVIDAEQVHGMPMSYNNFLDIDAAARIVSEFDGPTVVIIKHTNPCGVAIASDPMKAYRQALECDKRAAFGGIVGLNRELGADVASEIIQVFTEVVVAPSFTGSAIEVLSRKKNLRVIEWPGMVDIRADELELRSLGNAFLGQRRDLNAVDRMTTPTVRSPTDDEWKSLMFAWKVCKHVKSNSIIVARGERTVGIGAGQMARVDSVTIAVERAGKKAKNAALASDGFFPFPDSVERAADAGISAIIQPGGSIKDREVVKAADDNGIAMVISGQRTFLH